MTLSTISPIASAAALVLSVFTLWFTALRRGTVRSTHPAIIAVRYDFVGRKVPQAKVFMRMLLFSTGKRGHVVETLFLRVKEGGRLSEFSFWGYGDKDDLMAGSGLFVPETGVATNHHFNPLDAENVFLFSGGKYSFELVAKLVGRKRLLSLWTIEVEMPAKIYSSTITADTMVMYSWSPEQGRYAMSIENQRGRVGMFSYPVS